MILKMNAIFHFIFANSYSLFFITLYAGKILQNF